MRAEEAVVRVSGFIKCVMDLRIGLLSKMEHVVTTRTRRLYRDDTTHVSVNVNDSL